MHWLVALWWKQSGGFVRVDLSAKQLIIWFFSTFKLKKQMLLVFQLSKKLWINIAMEDISLCLD